MHSILIALGAFTICAAGCVPAQRQCSTMQCYRAQREASLRTAHYSGHYIGKSVGAAASGSRRYYGNPYRALQPSYNFFLDQMVQSFIFE